MFLKSLEVQGFKSFADKTVLDFNGDITAIVGPNGSGKSNISDAIRWVLGEQSTKALRGGKMEDVIFGGTQKRPAKGYAEASLVLDNSDSSLRVDASEVMVTRRYFRSGESEYYINRQLVRLRDVNELFMDTGIGREGYSNIGQGKIDEILSLKSTERRSVFEEASGISAFRYRKEETEKKLESTESNLLRIGDKIAELELQLTPLKDQAEKAQKYLLLRDELRISEISQWTIELERITADKTKIEADYNSCIFILEQERANLDELYRTVDELTYRVREYDEKLENERKEAEICSEELHAVETEKAALINSLSNKKTAISQLREELASDGMKTDGLKQKIEGYEARIAEILSFAAALEGRKETAAAKLSALGENGRVHSEEYTRISADIGDVRVQISADEQEKASAAEQLTECEAQSVNMEGELSRLFEKKDELESSVTSLKRSVTEEKEEIGYAENSIRGYELRISAKSDKTEKLEKALADADKALQETKTRLHVLSELQSSYEGFSNPVKTVMQLSERKVFQHVHGPVSTVLRTEKEYELAIETALLGAGQDVIVDTPQDAEKIMNYLKTKNAGRVTFLPLSVICGNPLKERAAEKMPGYIGLASSLVSFSKEYEQIILYVLGRTVIAENLSLALKIAEACQRRFRIVTLDGQVVNAGGSMTGGSAAVKAGVLSRANEIDELTSAASKLTEKVKKYSDDALAARKTLDADRFEKASAEQLRAAHSENLIRLEAELKTAETLLQSVDEACSAGEKSIAENKEKIQQLCKRIDVLKAQTAALNEKLQSLTEEQEAISLRLSAASEEEKTLNAEIMELSGKISALQSEKESSVSAAEQFRELLAQLGDEHKDKQQLLNAYLTEQVDIEKEIGLKDTEILHQQERVDRQKLAVETTLKTRNDLDEKKVQASAGIRTKNDEVLTMEREKARLANRLSVFETNEKQLLDKLWDTYELTRSSAEEQANRSESYTQLQKKTGELRRKIAALGTPNLGAIEEYNRVNERYTYLSGQRDDVVNAKEELLKILQNITAEMTSIFSREFEKISRYFGETFREMFEGGHAELFLEDPGRPLECGIEIRVQPPGKQLKTITLLSGGEKAFVAIALYFAILKVRPSPFCMLDEIDAALDDRNVDRFAAYLNNLSHNTQFIVITHRRGTMEAADMLYGVTMQERGVSTILRLNLDEVSLQLGIKE